MLHGGARTATRPARGTHTHEQPRRDGEHGLGQHAPCLACRHHGGERVGSHASLRWIHGMEPKRGKRRAGDPALPAMLHLRQQAMPKGRLRLPKTNRAIRHNTENREQLMK